jgi:uncharacterized protein YidB (DUF937 family)
MGLFDTILGGIEAKDTQHAALYAEVGSLVNQAGGVSGLEQQFQQKGLGGVISGWISNGPNPGISGEQIVDALGKDKITAIAAKAGLTEDQVAAGVSKLLPLVVDHLTPNGTVPPHSPTDVNAALGALKTKLLGS